MSKRTLSARLIMDDDAAPAASGYSPPGIARSPLVVQVRTVDDRTVVTVSGAVDVTSAQALRGRLYEAVRQSPRGIELDLGAVGHCDAHALDALLRVRRHAMDHGKTVTILTPGADMSTLLSETGTLPLFTAGSESGSAQDPYTELAQLRRAMRTRPVIDLARGVLMASFGLSAEDAWQVLVSVSQNTNTKLHRVAGGLVGAVTGDPLPEDFQELLAATVAKVRTNPGQEPRQNPGQEPG
ncbi:ANTAR domain-containing protein [Streptomyces antnestii]|nr:ANTAR domain-containing protein [Streptomyces sp. San01]